MPKKKPVLTVPDVPNVEIAAWTAPPPLVTILCASGVDLDDLPPDTVVATGPQISESATAGAISALTEAELDAAIEALDVAGEPADIVLQPDILDAWAGAN